MRTFFNCGLGVFLVVTACKGGESNDTGETGVSAGMTTTSGGTTTGSETTLPTTAGTETTAVDPTTSADPTSGTSSTGDGTSSTGEAETGPGESSGTTGPGIDCMDLSDGPFEPAPFADGFDGSEDLAFNGLGGLALKRDGGVVVITADLGEVVLAPDVPTAYGTRYLADGRLLVALPQDGKVIAIDGQGAITDFVTQVQGANGLYPDLEGNVWITEFGGDRVIRVAPDLTKTTIVMGNDAGAANGVVYDPNRGLLFYTNYQAGEIRRVPIDDQGDAGAPELVIALQGTAPDGLAMDACGYLYVVDQGNNDLYRVLLDDAGVATNMPDSPMATFPSNVANAQFGVGAGFDPHTLYVAGNPGDVYTLQVEFPGAPIATVQ